MSQNRIIEQITFTEVEGTTIISDNSNNFSRLMQIINLSRDLIEHIEGNKHDNESNEKDIQIENLEKDRMMWLEDLKKQVPDIEEVKLDDNFYCPISKELMYDPVINICGNTYEKVNILKWFKINNKDPLTNVTIENKILIPNNSLKSIINQELDSYASFKERFRSRRL